MKILKIILILVLLFSMSVFGQDTRTADIQDGDITFEIPQSWHYEPGDSMNWDPDRTYWTYTKDSIKIEPETLLEWFKSLTLNEKIEVYRWWKYDSVNLKIVSEYGELFIRLDDISKEGE